jgi:lysophospholipase L1-like esterase
MSPQRTTLKSALSAAAGLAMRANLEGSADPESGPSEPSSPRQASSPSETIVWRRPAGESDLATSEPNTTPTKTAIPSPTPPGLLYLALGDSYTIGEKVASGERFPGQLTQRLRATGVEMRSPQIIARTGWTTTDLFMQIVKARPQGPFDLVTLLIGVNNQYRGMNLDEYQREFEVLVEQAIDFTGMDAGRVIVLSLPDWGVMPYARNFSRALIGQQIDAFNRANKAIAGAKGVRYVNITPLSRKCGENASLVASDGLHPSAKQYQQWVDLILPEALAALGQ